MSEGASHEDQSLKIGDCVFVYGLESEKGKLLNDERGIVTGMLEATGRLQVRLSPEKVVSFKAQNLKKTELTVAERLKVVGLAKAGDADETNDRPTSEQEQGQEQEVPQSESQSKEFQGGDPAPGAAAKFGPGNCVEVFGLESESGRLLNGQVGIIGQYIVATGRFEVRFGDDKTVSLRPENLRKKEFTVDGLAPQSASGQTSPTQTFGKEAMAGNSEAAAAAAETTQNQKSPGDHANNDGGERRDRSRSRSSSSSSQSHSRSRRATPNCSGTTATSVSVGDTVEVFGLESEGGRQLNGQRGCIVRHLTERGRFEVSFGSDRLVSLRPDNLRKVDHTPTVTQPVDASSQQQAKPVESKPASLASLLSMGRCEPEPEKPKPAAWESVWSRSGSTAPSGGLTNEQVEFFQQMQAEDEQRDEEKKRLRLKVAAELAQAGVHDEEMLESVYQQQLKDMELQRLLRPQQASRARSRSPSSSSSSSSSSSRSRSRSREKAKDPPPPL